MKPRLVNGDGFPINEELAVKLINLPLHTVFRQVDVIFQQTLMSHKGKYPYKAYFDTILKTNQRNQENILTSQLFYKGGGPDISDAKTGPNAGLFKRYLATASGKL